LGYNKCDLFGLRLGIVSPSTVSPQRPYGDPSYESLAHAGEMMTTAAMAQYACDQIDQARADSNNRADFHSIAAL